MSLIKKVINFFKAAKESIKKFGIICSLKLFLRRIGFKSITPYYSFRYPLTDYEFKVVFRNNYWLEIEKGLKEYDCFMLLLDKVKQGQTIIDAGAWEGAFTLLFSKLTGSSGKVISFDPDQKAFKNLTKNVKKNNLLNVRLENKGLSNETGSKMFYLVKGGGQSQSTLVFHKEGYEKQYTKAIDKINIQITTLDEFCEENDIIPDGLKVDVEGAEVKLIEGAQSIIKKYSPWMLIEFHGMYMPEEEKLSNWQKIIEFAKKVIYVDGDSKKYKFGMEIDKLPQCASFHAFIQY